MQTVDFDTWTLHWAINARQIPQGGLLAGLLAELAADHRQGFLAPTVRFPLHPAARALGVHPVVFRTALRRLSEARLLNWTTDNTPDTPHITVTLLPPTSRVR